MKKILKFLLVSISIFFYSCEAIDKKVSITPFNIDNIDNIIVDSFDDKNLNSQGFNRIVVDLLVYEKKVKDTVVQLEFDSDFGFIRTKNWKINLQKGRESEIKHFIQKKYGVLSFDSYTAYGNEKDEYSFPAIQNKGNSLFLCHVSKDDKNYYLNITYYNPVVKRK